MLFELLGIVNIVCYYFSSATEGAPLSLRREGNLLPWGPHGGFVIILKVYLAVVPIQEIWETLVFVFHHACRSHACKGWTTLRVVLATGRSSNE